jgi:hypothetical protein
MQGTWSDTKPDSRSGKLKKNGGDKLKRSWLLLLIALGFILNSCIEAEVDIDLKRGGSGEMRMKILPLDTSLNPMIDQIENDLMRKENYKDSDITKKIESDGRKSLFVRKKFNRVEEADDNCKFVSQKDHDEFIMNLPGDLLGIVKKVRIKMPGQIIGSNVKNFEGRSLTWDRTSSPANRLIIKSKPAEPIGNTILILVILLLAIGVIAAILILKRVRKPKIIAQGISFCPECGGEADAGDNFCQNCGQSLR